MDVNYTINRLQLRGTAGSLEPREPRVNPDGTLEIGGQGGVNLLFRPAAAPGSFDANQVLQGMPNFLELYEAAKL
jgi:hypothetical protein